MNKSDHEDLQSFRRELDQYRAIISQYKERLEAEPWLEKQIFFWMESIRFLITELEVWDRIGDDIEQANTAKKVQKIKQQLDTLILQLTGES